MNCARTNCTSGLPATLHPRLLLRPTPDQIEPLVMVIGAPTCAACAKTIRAEDFCAEPFWTDTVVRSMRAVGKAVPAKRFTQIEWVSIDESPIPDGGGA